MKIQDTAEKFADALDNNDFVLAKSFLSENCTYKIGDKILRGPDEIMNLYEDNMEKARKKLDSLTWGKGYIESVEGNVVSIIFTDYLTHKNLKHIHKIRQLLTFNSDEYIMHIENIELPGETNKLKEYFKQVEIEL